MRTLILRDMNKTFLLSALAVLALTGVGLLVTVGSVGGTKQAGAQQGLTLALDMDITDGGPCASIDDAAAHSPGDEYDVALCVSNMSTPIGAFQASVFYDDTLNSSPNIACPTGDCLDTNPDANAGATTWGSSLGGAWDCNILDLLPAMGDRDAQAANGTGEAYIACWSLYGPYSLGDDEADGVLALISFSATAGGEDSLTIGEAVIAGPDGNTVGACNPPLENNHEMTCSGGTDTKSGTPPPTRPPTMTLPPTNTPCPNGVCPTSTHAPTRTPGTGGGVRAAAHSHCPPDRRAAGGLRLVSSELGGRGRCLGCDSARCCRLARQEAAVALALPELRKARRPAG